MPENSNIDEVQDSIHDLLGTFNFRLDIGSTTLGEDLRDLVAQMIHDRSINLQRGAEEPWAPLRGWYLSWKSANFGVELIGVLTGQMLSINSLRGDTRITDHEIEMTYGTGDPSPAASTAKAMSRRSGNKRRRKRTLNRIAKEGSRTTDREKATWFTDGCSVDSKGRNQNRPGRSFFEVDDVIEDAVIDHCQDALDSLLR